MKKSVGFNKRYHKSQCTNSATSLAEKPQTVNDLREQIVVSTV